MKRIATLLAYLEEILFLADLFPRLIADHRKNGLRFFFFFYIYIFSRASSFARYSGEGVT